MKLKIRPKATVEVISGADKGTKGTVISVDTKGLRIKVQGVNKQTHFDREKGLEQKEGYIDYSNVKLISNATKTQKKSTAKSKSAK